MAANVSGRGRFVVFEGIDGSGKSTAIAAVAAALRGEGIAAWLTREETDSWRGDAVRRSIAEHGDALATAFLFLADRAAHVHEIEAKLADGQHVLCDRFLHSTLAYQSVALGDRVADGVAWLRSLHEPWCPRPDGVVLFDVDAAVAVQRVGARAVATGPARTPSNYERVEVLARVAAAYRRLAAADGTVHVLDASRDAQAVAAAALAATRRILTS